MLVGSNNILVESLIIKRCLRRPVLAVAVKLLFADYRPPGPPRMSETPRTPLERVAHACMLLAIALRSSFSKPLKVLTAKVSQQSEMGRPWLQRAHTAHHHGAGLHASLCVYPMAH